jgi:hypothetical protein
MVQNIMPKTPAQTGLLNQYVDMKLTGDDQRAGPEIAAIRRLADQFTSVVGAEDRQILKQVQLGLSDAAPPRGILSASEQRISYFHRVYLRNVSV